MNITASTQRRLDLQHKLEAKYGSKSAAVTIISTEHPDLIEHKAGVLVQVTPEIASKMIFGMTHREATEAEQELYLLEMKDRTKFYADKEMERRLSTGQFAVLPANTLPTVVAPAVYDPPVVVAVPEIRVNPTHKK